MKVILVIADTLRRDHTGVLGNPPWWKIQTPTLQRFSQIASVFENAYIGSFPTIPNRRDTLLGKCDGVKPFNRGTLLTKSEVSFPAHLKRSGIPSMLIMDTPYLAFNDRNLYRDFSAWYWNRGQEGELCWLDQEVELKYDVPPELIRYDESRYHSILTNRYRRKIETDWFAPGTYTKAMEWLECNYKRSDFFLWIDTFDPHEPWDPPQYYIDLYDKDYEGRIFESPAVGLRKKMGITDRELKQMRARYSAEVTMVDTWFGRLLDKVEQLGIMDETVIIFTTDHGTNLDGPGDCGMVLKNPFLSAEGVNLSKGILHGYSDNGICMPLTINTVRIPLFIYAPGLKAVRTNEITQPWDLNSTILDFFNVKPADQENEILGRSLKPVLEGKSIKSKEYAICGNNNLIQGINKKWFLTIWRKYKKPCLIDLENDPACENNVFKENPQVVKEIYSHIEKYVTGQGLDIAKLELVLD